VVTRKINPFTTFYINSKSTAFKQFREKRFILRATVYDLS